jgi:predicted CoA-binding protein
MNNDADVLEMLKATKTIAVVGLSSDPFRPSHGVSEYMQHRGYRIIPVNPSEGEVLGEKAYASLQDVPESFEMINVFRRPNAVPEIVEQAIQRKVPYLWLQEGIVHEEAAKRAREAVIKVVMDRCVLKEHRRLLR